jgi:hypothetical protein
MTWMWTIKEVIDSIGAICGPLALMLVLSRGRAGRRPTLALATWMATAAAMAALGMLLWQHFDRLPSGQVRPIYQHLDADLQNCETHKIETSRGEVSFELCFTDLPI